MAITIPTPTVSYRRVAAKDLKYSVVLHIRGHEKSERTGKMVRVFATCSGTYVGSHEILTAAHCFDGYEVEKAWARGPYDALGYPVKLSKWDKPRDLAIVSTAYPHAYVRLGARPSVGDEVLNIGCPVGFEFVASQGIVSLVGYSMRRFNGSFTVSTAMIDHGSSGGGMFNKKGRLIGVNTISVGLFGWGGLSLAVDIGTIRRFLNEG